MPNLTGVTKYFPTAQEDFITTLSGTVASGAASVPLQSVTGYANGDTVCFVVDPSNSKKQVFTGTMDTGGSQVTGVKWTEGVNTTHNTGATVVDYVTATDMAMSTKGILVSHTQDGALRSTAVQTALGITGNPTAGWTPLGFVPLGTVYNGNRSYTCTFSGTDLTGTLSTGMKLLFNRTTAAPILCTSLNGSSQYYSKSSPNKMTFTDDFVVSAWVKLSSYAQGTVASRFNNTSGWTMRVEASGQVSLGGFNAGAANFSQVVSQQSVPLNKWVHIAAQLDMSTFTASTTTSYVMIDGVDVPASVSRGGSNPTALIQAGNLEIGSENAGTKPFPGKIAQVAIFNAKVTQSTIRAIISSGLFGTETSLASAYSFNNSIADLNTTTPNDLTANGSAVATNADSPFGGQADGSSNTLLEYAEVVSVSFSTNTTLTIRTPNVNTVPTVLGGIASMSYSLMASPYGFPGMSTVLASCRLSVTFTGNATTFTAIPALTAAPVTVPTGGKDLKITFSGTAGASSGPGNNWTMDIYDSTTSVQVGSSNLITIPVASFSDNGTFVVLIPNPTPGVHIYQARYTQSGAGTFTINASATGPATLIVEQAT